MGIVVSEDGNAGGPTEQQRVDVLAAENDYGLVMATIDQVSVFLGTWWTSSLAGRIQVSWVPSCSHESLVPLADFSRSIRHLKAIHMLP